MLFRSVPQLSNITLVVTKFWPRCSAKKRIPNKLGTRKDATMSLNKAQSLLHGFKQCCIYVLTNTWKFEVNSLILTIPIKCDVLNVLHDGTGHAIIGK